jgi:hypothetical protein
MFGGGSDERSPQGPAAGGELATFPSGLTGRSDYPGYVLATTPTLYLLLSFYRAGSVRMTLLKNQSPGSPGFGVFRAALFVTFQASRYILCAANIVTAPSASLCKIWTQ